MKLIEDLSIEYLNQALTFETSDCKIIGRIEPYSCKSGVADKKLYNHIEQKYKKTPNEDGTSLSNSLSNSVESPFGRFNVSTNRKTYFYMISVLNATFPDYDFSDIKPDQFNKINSIEMVMNHINLTLINAGGQAILNETNLWSALDSIIQLSGSEVYSYAPENVDDPLTEKGCIWSFNYFFFNKDLKRILYYTCRCISLKNRFDEGIGASLSEEGSSDYEDMSYIDDDLIDELEF